MRRQSPWATLAIALGSAIFSHTAGSLTFETALTFEVAGAGPRTLVCGDFNADQHLDLALTTGIDASNVTLLLGDGQGRFDDDHPFKMPTIAASGLAYRDLDGDTRVDFIVTNAELDHGDVHLLRADRDGQLTQVQTLNAIGRAIRSVVTGDFNADGRIDIAVGGDSAPIISVFWNLGDGHFSAAQPIERAGQIRANTMIATDLNNDDRDDILLPDAVFIAQTDGSFTKLIGFGGGVGLVSAWVDDDHYADVIVAQDDAVFLWAGLGDGRFRLAQQQSIPAGASALAAADLDRDTRLDLIIAYRAQDTLRVLTSTTDATLWDRQTDWAIGREPVALTLGDWNHDGAIDIASALHNRADTPSIAIRLQTVDTGLLGEMIFTDAFDRAITWEE